MTIPALPVLLMFCTAFALSSCGDSPKTIASEESSEGSTGVFEDGAPVATSAPSGMPGGPVEADVHTVTALEVLPTRKYVYVRVNENGHEFWIASMKQEVALGKSYFYRGGLLKTDFVSKEYNRTFDELFLVSQLVPSDHGTSGGMTPTAATGEAAPAAMKAGSVRIADIIAKPQDYEGRTVQVSGTCVKLNANIMGRNWIHLSDGGKNAKELVVTSAVPFGEGQQITVAGTIVLKKDFGSGYSYDILMEDAVPVK